MSEIKLFRTVGSHVSEVRSGVPTIEKSLQTLIERNAETILGVMFLATEYSTGRVHAGRIDTLGIDEDGCPVIVEYKRNSNENVINQGLFYLDWLLDHKAEFELLVMKSLGSARAQTIDWSAPRLICIAGDFNRYDEHAVQQINRNIDLFRYRRFGSDLLALQLVDRRRGAVPLAGADSKGARKQSKASKDKPVQQAIDDADGQTRDVLVAAREFTKGLGDDVEERALKLYLSYRRIKTFACIVVKKQALLFFLKLDPASTPLEQGFTRDVSNIGHWGTGDVEVTVRSIDDLKRAEPLIAKSYQNS